MKKKLFIIIGILALALLAWWIFKSDDKTTDSLITSYVKKDRLVWSVDAVGEVFAQNLVDVGTRATGQIKELYVKVGDEVEVGDKIAQIDDKIQRNTLAQRESELISLKAKLNSAKVAFDIAKSQYNRELALAKNNATSKENLENFKNAMANADANVKTIEASIAQSEISIQTAKEDLGYTNIIAPFAGTIVSVPVEVGQTLNAVQSAPTVAQIADLSKMEIKMEVSEADVGNIKVGDKIEYNILSDINKKYDAKISSIDPGLTTLSDGMYSANSKTSGTSKAAVYYYVKALIDNKDNTLRIGMTTQNKIIVKDLNSTLQIPLTALKIDKNGPYVILKNNEDLIKQEIKTGIRSNNAAQVLEGLKEGDTVVVSQMSQDEINKIIESKRIRLH